MPALVSRNRVTAFVQHLGLVDVAVKADGSCGLLFDGDLNVTLEPDPDHEELLHAHTVIAPVPAEAGKVFFVHLLRGNYLGRATGGAVLTLNAEGTQVLLQARLSATSLDMPAMADWMADFVRTSRLWQQRLVGPVRATAASSRDLVEYEPAFASMIRV